MSERKQQTGNSKQQTLWAHSFPLLCCEDLSAQYGVTNIDEGQLCKPFQLIARDGTPCIGTSANHMECVFSKETKRFLQIAIFPY
jgi:hypothetical protein